MSSQSAAGKSVYLVEYWPFLFDLSARLVIGVMSEI